MKAHLIPSVAAFIKKHGEMKMQAGDTISYNHPVLRNLISNVVVLAIDHDAELYPLALDTEELLAYTHHIILENGSRQQLRSIRSHTLIKGEISAPTRREMFAAAIRDIPVTVFADAQVEGGDKPASTETISSEEDKQEKHKTSAKRRRVDEAKDQRGHSPSLDNTSTRNNMDASDSDDDLTLAVGMEFASVAVLRRCVEDFCIENGFSHKKPVNRENYLIVVCSTHVDCPFMLRASRSSATHIVTVRHSDIHVAHTNLRQRLPSTVSHEFLVQVARTCASYSAGETTPGMVKTRARQDHGLIISYHSARRALQDVHDGTVHHHNQSYQYLESWLGLFASANPGSVTGCERDDRNAFKRVCLIFGIFANALQYCLPIIAVDACHLKGPDKGTPYVASTMTGSHDILIVGLAICNAAENGEDWIWFLSHLSRGVPSILQIQDIFFMSDRDKGIAPAVRQVFPNARHSHCAEHIKRNVIAEYKTHFSGLVVELAKEADVRRVDEIFDEIGGKNKEAGEYLRGIDSSLWITASFPVPRYGIVTSNSAEAVNSSLGDLRKASHLKILAGITQKVNQKMHNLRNKYSQREPMDLCPAVKKKLSSNKKAGRARLAVPQSTTECEVQRKDASFRVVNFEANHCTCGAEFQYPCVHGCAVLQKLNRSVEHAVAPYYRYACLQAVFHASLTPIDINTTLRDGITKPPPRYRSAGRPRHTSRLRSRGDLEPEESPIVCSKCGRRGHNTRTCDKRRALRENRANAQKKSVTR